MSRVGRLIQLVASDATDEQIVNTLAELSGDELAKLREFGLMIVELARDGFDEMTLPEQHKAKPTWQVKRDELGLRLIENPAPVKPAQHEPPLPGFLLDGDDLPEVLVGLGVNEFTAPDGRVFELVPGPECDYLTDRDPGDEGDCEKW